jgi:hypothetical protein
MISLFHLREYALYGFLETTTFSICHQRVVAPFSDLILNYNGRGLTHISQILWYLAILEGVGYEVHRYINTGALPYEELSHEQRSMDTKEW